MCYADRMSEINLADPSFEPTDEQLEGLARSAFAEVRERHARALARIEAEIESERANVLRELRRSAA